MNITKVLLIYSENVEFLKKFINKDNDVLLSLGEIDSLKVDEYIAKNRIDIDKCNLLKTTSPFVKKIFCSVVNIVQSKSEKAIVGLNGIDMKSLLEIINYVNCFSKNQCYVFYLLSFINSPSKEDDIIDLSGKRDSELKNLLESFLTNKVLHLSF